MGTPIYTIQKGRKGVRFFSDYLEFSDPEKVSFSYAEIDYIQYSQYKLSWLRNVWGWIYTFTIGQWLDDEEPGSKSNKLYVFLKDKSLKEKVLFLTIRLSSEQILYLKNLSVDFVIKAS